MKQHPLRALVIGGFLGTLMTGAVGSQTLDQPNGNDDSETWSYSLTIDDYTVPGEAGYVSPVLAADRSRLHVEARYNYESLSTASLWVGYNFNTGKRVTLSITPMIGGVVGGTNGFALGFEASLVYKKLTLSISNEYVFDTTERGGSFYYSWPQLTYSPVPWFQVGLVAQRTKAYRTPLDVQRGVLVGASYKKIDFTTYIFNAGWTYPTVVLEVGAHF
jgi:hypothetical protein